MKIPFYCVIILLISFTSSAQLKSPKEFLGYELGEAFTRHHRVIDYFNHIAEEKNNVRIQEYGTTYENRPLIAAMITAEKNFSKLDEIRSNNLKRAKMRNGAIDENGLVVVWLSYNVHGNESVSTEAAMETLYLLANPSENIAKWLENTVVIIDPCINPDGRDRYVNWYYQYGNFQYDPDPNGKEHHEPWVSGRVNHYLFDLNRDWVWLSQKESIQRVKLYNQWMPQIHVDFHEQNVNSPYYFAPAAEPYHEVITDWQREFQSIIGRNHAKYFDAKGWLYFTKEVFDLLYPSYGDTYPTFNGAIGMTYEQGGSGRAGLGVITDEGDTLTLKDRIAHHVTTGLSTVEVASLNADKLLQEFGKYFSLGATNQSDRFKSFIIKGSNSLEKIKKLKQLLDIHAVRYGYLSQSKTIKGYNYQERKDESNTISKDDLIIPLAQPKSLFIKSLFEPEAFISDSITYDITAWSVPYSFGLKTIGSYESLSINLDQTSVTSWVNPQLTKKTYAFVSTWESESDLNWLSALLQAGIKVRYVKEAFTLDENNYKPGSLLITRKGNEHLGEEFDNMILNIAEKHEKVISPAYTGFVDAGKDFGSSAVRFIHAPKIAVLSGKGTSSLAFGEIWHYFEQQIGYPVTILDTDYFSRVKLSQYDVLILPNGSYGNFLDENTMANLLSWIKQGGKLIAMEGALTHFSKSDDFGLKMHENESKNGNNGGDVNKGDNETKLYENRERDAISKYIFGSIFKTKLDNTHPLGFGYENYYFTLKRSDERYFLLKNGWNVATIGGKENKVSGFSGATALDKIENSLVFGVESIGDGNVIYMVDNPLFRAFWQHGKLLFGNAVFLVGQ